MAGASASLSTNGVRVASSDEPMVVLAAIAGAHGIAGEVRLKLFTDELGVYPVLHAGARTLTLRSVRPGPNGAVARFAEVTDRTAAEALRGTPLSVPRSALLPTPFRARRVCCLRYEIPGETQLCGSCPLLLTMDDAALAEQDAIR